MTAFRTCLGCRLASEYCAKRSLLSDQIAGLGLTSIKFRCRHRESLYKPGDLVWARLPYDWGDQYYPEGMASDDFPGVVIKEMTGSIRLVYVAQGALSPSGIDFIPKGNGFCKVRVRWLKPRDGEREEVCGYCLQPVAQIGHGDWCRPQDRRAA